MHRVDDGSMKFLVSRQKNVREILALCVSPNKRVIAVCEKGRAPDEDPGSAQVHKQSLVHTRESGGEMERRNSQVVTSQLLLTVLTSIPPSYSSSNRLYLQAGVVAIKRR